MLRSAGKGYKMIIIGEKLNSSIPSANEAMNSGDEAVTALIKKQADAGADFIDINTALCTDETEMMKKMISLVRMNCECGIMVDSPDHRVLSDAAKLCGGRELIINSVTCDERIDEIAPVAAELSCGIVVLPIDSIDGIPSDADRRLANSCRAVEKLIAAGVSESNIYIDAICETLATGDTNARTCLETISLIKRNTGAKTVCGLSNISFGLPKRAFINSAFLSMAVFCGLDAAIIDPCSTELKKALFASEAVNGNDEFCMEYIGFIRNEYSL